MCMAAAARAACPPCSRCSRRFGSTEVPGGCGARPVAAPSCEGGRGMRQTDPGPCLWLVITLA